MKNYSLLFVFALLLGFSACQPNDSKKGGQPILNFMTKEFNFGTITEGEKVEYNFKFVNAGNGDLVIKSAEASCGCTVPKFSDKPVTPGESGGIHIEFNSDGKPGEAVKTVTVRSNTNPEQTQLVVKGTVIPKDKK